MVDSLIVKDVHLKKSCMSENLLLRDISMLCFVALLLKEVIESRKCGLAFAHFDYVMLPFLLCNFLFHDQQWFGCSLDCGW